jgi:hypothetical protein
MQIEIEDKGTYKRRKFLSLWLLFLFFIVPITGFADAPVIKNTVEYKPGCGHLRGFIYKPDGETPLWGAQVVLLDIHAGNYVVIILTRNKVYNIKQVDFLIKIIAGKTSTISFSLKKSLSVLMLFLKKPCCEAAVVSGTALTIALVKKFTELNKEPEQSPTQR